MPDVMPYLLCCSNYTRDGDYYNIPCKSSFITPVTESDATLKEAQTLARHSTPQLTMNVYGRLREGRLSNVIEQVAENINTQKKSAIYVQKKTSGENEEDVTPSTPEALEDNTTMEVGGIEPPSENVKVRTSTCVAHFLNLVPESSNRRDITGTSLSFSLAPCPETQHGASLPYRRS